MGIMTVTTEPTIDIIRRFDIDNVTLDTVTDTVTIDYGHDRDHGDGEELWSVIDMILPLITRDYENYLVSPDNVVNASLGEDAFVIRR